MTNIHDEKLALIYNKVIAGVPVSTDDAYTMLTTNDIMGLGFIANTVKKEMHGNIIYYGVNMNLNYTNICLLRCPLCAFSRDKRC